ncbi:MAG: HEAT repeat domain-containing protein, partial [Planctomycetota bacterium]
FRKLGKGDLVYEYARNEAWLICLRGAKMQLRTDQGIKSVTPGVERQDFTGYFLENVPCQYQVTTAEGDKFALKVLSVEKGDNGRVQIEYRKVPAQVETEKSQSLIFHGLDLAVAPHTSNSSKLPDLFEARPPGSESYHIRKDVTVVYMGSDGTVYYVPKKNVFYVQHDLAGAGTLHYYGPFDGDPYVVLKLETYPDYFFSNLLVKSRPAILPAKDSTTLRYEIKMDDVPTAAREDHAKLIIELLRKMSDREDEFKLVWKAVGQDKIEVTIPKDSEQRMKSIWGEAVDGIACAVRPVKETFLPGEQLQFDVVYKNTSRQPITVCVYPDPFYVWTQLWVLDSQGMWVASGQHANGIRSPISNSDFVTLQPGETASVRQNITVPAEGKYILKPGRYTVFASASKINRMWKHIIGFDEFCQKNNLRPWTGVIETGRSSFKIVSNTDHQHLFTVHGTVTDKSGHPMEDVRLTADCGHGKLERTGRTVTDKNGRYELILTSSIKNLGADPYDVGIQTAQIEARAKGFYEANICRGGYLAMAGKPPGPDEQRFVAEYAGVVLPHKPYELNFVMHPAARIEGELVDGQDNPMPRLGLWLNGDNLYLSNRVNIYGRTDRNGKFIIDDIPCKSIWFMCPQPKLVQSGTVDLTMPGTYRVKLRYVEWTSGEPSLTIAEFRPPAGERDAGSGSLQPDDISPPVLGYDVKLNFADPISRDGSFHGDQSVAFSLSFHKIGNLQTDILFGRLLVGQTTWPVQFKDDTVTFKDGSSGKTIRTETWSKKERRFDLVLPLPLTYGKKRYVCPVHIEMTRTATGKPLGSYWFCAYLSGRLPWGAGGRIFEIVNLDQQMEFRPVGDGTDKRDAVLGIDINGDGKIDPAQSGGEQFDLYEPFEIGSKTYRVREVDPYSPRVAFLEVKPGKLSDHAPGIDTQDEGTQEPNEPTYGGRSLSELIGALDDQDWQTRIKAVYHLGYMGPKAEPAVPALVDALSEERLRESILHSLANIGTGAGEAIPALIKAITEYAPACRWMAAEALAKIGDKAVPELKKSTESENIYLRIWCNAALAKQHGGDSTNLRYLAQLMKSADKKTAGEAVSALTMLGPISKP